MNDENWHDCYDETGRRFVEYYLRKGSEWGAETLGSRAAECLAKIQGIYGNLSPALVRAVSLMQHHQELWPLWRDTVIRLFNFYDYRGLWREMHGLLSLGEREARRMEDTWARCIYLFFQARIESQIGQRESALSKTAEAFSLCNLVNDDGLHSSLLHFQGILLRRTEPHKAREYYDMSLVISKRLKNRAGEASTLYEIGRMEERAGNKRVAQMRYEEALSIFSELNQPRERATLLFQIGGLRSDLGYLQEALLTYEGLGDLRGYAQTLHQMGNVAKEHGELPEAQQFYQEASVIFRKLGLWRSAQTVEEDSSGKASGAYS